MTKIINKNTTYRGKIVSVDSVDLDFENGKKGTYEIINFKVVTGVSALPIYKDQIILIKHYQAGIKRAGLSLPTGGLNPGENPYKRMNTELMEEIGMRSNDLTLMARLDILPGYIGSEAGYTFLARDLVSEKLEGDEEYKIELVYLPLPKALEMVKAGEITDLRTTCTLLWYKQFLWTN